MGMNWKMPIKLATNNSNLCAGKVNKPKKQQTSAKAIPMMAVTKAG